MFEDESEYFCVDVIDEMIEEVLPIWTEIP